MLNNSKVDFLVTFNSIDYFFFQMYIKGLKAHVGKSMGRLEIRIRVNIYTGYIDILMGETFVSTDLMNIV